MQGKITEGRGKKKYFINHGGIKGYVEVSKKEYEKAFPDAKRVKLPMTNSLKGWPRKSLAFGVHPKQVDAAIENSVKLGVPTDFDRKTGRAVFRDNQHQREYTKVRGCRNNDGGYGQITS